MSIYQRINGADWRNIWVVGDLHGCHTLLMNELESDYCGTVKQILVSNGEMVEYGQPLFIVEEQN